MDAQAASSRSDPTVPASPAGGGAPSHVATTEARYERLIAAAALVTNGASCLVDRDPRGFSGPGLLTLAVHLVATLSAALWLAGSLKQRPPAWLEGVKLWYIAASTGGVILIGQVHPTHITSQGVGIIAAWAVAGLLVRARVGRKLALNAVLYALYVVHLFYGVSALGDAYATPHERMVVLICGAVAAFVLPWAPHYVEEQRVRQLAIQKRLEERERELVREKARADAAAADALRIARQAEREAALRTRLFANVTHDLRTPIAGIVGIVEMLRDTPLTSEQVALIETIRASNQTLLSLLDDVVDFARVEERKLPIAPIAVSLNDTLRRPADLIRVAAERKGLELRLDLPEDLPQNVILDPVRIQQVLLNLLGNAVKFTKSGTVTLRARAVGGARDPLRLRIEVEDMGIGFTQEESSRLFGRFSQVGDKTSEKFGGSGLGLSICKGIVEMMGGTIGAEGRPGRGATFWFEVPTARTGAPKAPETASAVPNLRVLLAEDNLVNQLVIATMLRKLGQEVVVTDNGEDALERLTTEPFDLALMDMKMPRLDGEEVTRRLRGGAGPASRLYVVALTASATAEQQAEFRAAGVDAIYTKPIDLERLRRLLIQEGAAALSRRG